MPFARHDTGAGAAALRKEHRVGLRGRDGKLPKGPREIPGIFSMISDRSRKNSLTRGKNFAKIHFVLAGIAHLVERHLAKVEVASSSLVARSRRRQDT